MSTPEVLMCRPTFYGIEYEINPWMNLRRQANRALALRQWEALRTALTRECGARVRLCRARPGLPDMTFTANAGLVRGRTFFPTRFAYRERAGEVPFFRRWFRRHGFRVVELPGSRPFEGAGDGLFLGDTLFAGYYVRSEVQPHAFLSQALDVRVLSLALVNPYFYHLDTCFAPVSNECAVYYPDAFDRYGRKVIREHVPDLIAVSGEEAYNFGCNLVAIGGAAIVSQPCRRLARALGQRGLRPIRLDFSEFIKAGGAARCLTLRVR